MRLAFISSAIPLVLLSVIALDDIILKDGTLDGLANLINAKENVPLYSKWSGGIEDMVNFLSIVEPWILNESHIPLNTYNWSVSTTSTTIMKPVNLRGAISMNMKQIIQNEVDCKNPSYRSVLSGYVMNSPHADSTIKKRLIVDIVPFGYDADKLLIRFHETYDVVDVYIIHESTYTLLGIPKKRYYPLISKQDRFKPFQDKVLYTFSDGAHIGPVAAKAREKVFQTFNNMKYQENLSGREIDDAIWEMDRYCKRDPIRSFLILNSSHPQYHLKEMIMTAIKDKNNMEVYAIQNDADEIVKGDVLKHIKYCDIKKEVLSIYTPCFSFKNNFHWLQKTFDMKYFSNGKQSKREVWKDNRFKYWDTLWFEEYAVHRELNDFLWKIGPYVWPMTRMLHHSPPGNLRDDFTKNEYTQYHMGYGAAIHMSSVNDPVEVLMKSCGTVENINICGHILPDSFIEKAQKGVITGKDIYSLTIKPWCHKRNIGVHVSTLSSTAQRIISQSIPFIIKDNPIYFTFMYPKLELRNTGLFNKCARQSWHDECSKS
jgi:hypothetical protein